MNKWASPSPFILKNTLISTLISKLTLFLAGFASATIMQSYPQPVEIPPAQEKEVINIESLIVETAKSNGIDPKVFLNVAKCESSLDPSAIGDSGSSLGLWQIHIPSHPTVASSSALDPVWSTNWAKDKFKEDPTIWTCYGTIKKNQGV